MNKTLVTKVCKIKCCKEQAVVYIIPLPNYIIKNCLVDIQNML